MLVCMCPYAEKMTTHKMRKKMTQKRNLTWIKCFLILQRLKRKNLAESHTQDAKPKDEKKGI